ncbi:MAG TPA: FadR/GntR family transcriptional regulator, partial [Vicinamibacteria bacterium]|nr:FadR/GntR family transcriptional regulator [Vicinamibacteria bacterium]
RGQRGMTNTRSATPAGNPDDDALAAERVVTHIERLIVSGQLKPGDRLPAERELARHVKVSRPSVRAGLRSLSAVGVVEARHGAGSFITAGPPRLSTGPLSLLAALHGFTRDDMFDARRVLEMGAARLAAERAAGEDMATMSEEVAGMFASLEDPQAFLVHDVRFHRAVAAGSHNPVLAALVEMVSTMVYERRRLTVERARDLKESAEMHRRIYAAIRDHDPERARQEMSEHLDLARMAQASEDVPDDGVAAIVPPAPAPPPPSARR